MNRIDRLLGILLTFQAQKRVSSETLAKLFNISRRTIYRDVNSLYELGIPIAPLNSKDGYELVGSVPVAPLVFTEEEAFGLWFGLQLMIKRLEEGDTTLGKHFQKHTAERALNKLTLGIPKNIREQLEALFQKKDSCSPFSKRCKILQEIIYEIRYAIENKISLNIVVKNQYKWELESLNIDPYRLEMVGRRASSSVFGYCTEKNICSSIPLINIVSAKSTKLHFTPKDEEGYKPSFTKIVLRFSKRLAHRVKISQHKDFVKEEKADKQGRVVMHYSTQDPENLFLWTLGWASDLEILEPTYFKNRAEEEFSKALARYNSNQ